MRQPSLLSLQDYERRLSDMEEARERALQELTEHYEAKLQEKNIQLEQVRKWVEPVGVATPSP